MDNKIDHNKIFGSIIAAQLTNAHYCALLLKQQNGVVVTDEVERQTLQEVLSSWRGLCRLFDDALLAMQDISQTDQG